MSGGIATIGRKKTTTTGKPVAIPLLFVTLIIVVLVLIIIDTDSHCDHRGGRDRVFEMVRRLRASDIIATAWRRRVYEEDVSDSAWYNVR